MVVPRWYRGSAPICADPSGPKNDMSDDNRTVENNDTKPEVRHSSIILTILERGCNIVKTWDALYFSETELLKMPGSATKLFHHDFGSAWVRLGISTDFYTFLPSKKQNLIPFE